MPKTILITGAAGSIGSEVTPPPIGNQKYILLDRDEYGLYQLQLKLKDRKDIIFELADLSDEHRIKQILKHHQPDLIIHAAAYKQLPLLEQFPQEAYKNNTLVTTNLIDWASQAEVKEFIFISTDKAVNPTSHLGRSKRLGELYLLNDTSPMIKKIIRFGNVVHSRGALKEAFDRQLAEQGSIELTHEQMQRYFLTSKQLIQGMNELVSLKESGIFVIQMGAPRLIMDFAKEFLISKGYSTDAIQIVGIRPGEKLCEDLHFDFESPTQTYTFLQGFKGPIPAPDEVKMTVFLNKI